jgi:HTH-type transcriptional regulator, sugar sensing transcriptional regulator
LKSQEKIETLMKLGLTFYQAKAYLTLLSTGPMTVKGIAEASGIARPDLYRVIESLKKEGLVEEILAKPASFQAVSYIQVLPAMLKRKQTEQLNLNRETKELFLNLKNNHAVSPCEEDNEFTIVPSREAILHKLKEELQKAQNSVFTITTQKRFSDAILEFETYYRKALQRGVKIRLASEKHVPTETALRILLDLTTDSNFELKYFDLPPKAIVSIYDGKEACVALSSTAHLAGSSAIWSSNPCFVALAQNYFENQWNKAAPLLNEATN